MSDASGPRTKPQPERVRDWTTADGRAELRRLRGVRDAWARKDNWLPPVFPTIRHHDIRLVEASLQAVPQLLAALEAIEPDPAPALQVRPEVAAFAQAMERKLRDNDHKGGWKDCTTRYLCNRVMQEYAELRLATNPVDHPRSGAEVLSEACDVANFAMMTADVCGGLEADPAPALDVAEVLPLVRAAIAFHDAGNRDGESDDAATARMGEAEAAIDEAVASLPTSWKRAAREGGEHE